MRVLVISHGHPAFSIGGAEIAAYNLFRGLDGVEGVEAHFLSRAGAPLRRHAGTPFLSLRQGEREVFLHTEEWDEFWLSNRGLDDLSGAFARYLQHVRPDVVHFHHVIGLGIESLLKVRQILPSAAIVVTFHEFLSICANHGQMIKTVNKTLCSRATPADCAMCFPEFTPARMFQRELFIKDHLAMADAYVSPSRFLLRRYVDWGLPAERFHYAENGLDAQVPAPARKIAAGARRSRFGFFGQLSEWKGLHILLEAVTRVPERLWGDDASLVIFGGNLERQPEAFRTRFAHLMERAGSRARFYGSYRAEELPRLMAQVDWTVMASIWWENSPLVIQESFLHRRPLIVGDQGGMAEKVRDGIDGLHFRHGSPEDLADKFGEALSDSTLWERLSSQALDPPFLPQFAQEHLAIYSAALDHRRGAGTGAIVMEGVGSQDAGVLSKNASAGMSTRLPSSSLESAQAASASHLEFA
jgi:glycosyltransferase involved in cell wall biosynthesis